MNEEQLTRMATRLRRAERGIMGLAARLVVVTGTAASGPLCDLVCRSVLVKDASGKTTAVLRENGDAKFDGTLVVQKRDILAELDAIRAELANLRESLAKQERDSDLQLLNAWVVVRPAGRTDAQIADDLKVFGVGLEGVPGDRGHRPWGLMLVRRSLHHRGQVRTNHAGSGSALSGHGSNDLTRMMVPSISSPPAVIIVLFFLPAFRETQREDCISCRFSMFPNRKASDREPPDEADPWCVFPKRVTARRDCDEIPPVEVPFAVHTNNTGLFRQLLCENFVRR